MEKISFQRMRMQIPTGEQNITRILGTICIILYFLAILYPYFTSSRKGKIGWNDLKNNKYNLISTALRWSEKKVETFILVLFLILINIVYHYKGFYNKFDSRIILPIGSFVMVFSMILLMYVIPEKFVKHNALGLFIILSGVAMALYTNYVYSKYFDETDVVSINELSFMLIVVVSFGLFIGVYNIYNNYLRKVKLFPHLIPTIRNLLGLSEISSYILIGIILAIMISYPPIP